MKRWAALTVLLYLICLSALAVPLLCLLGGGDGDLFAMFFAYVVPVMLVVQIALLAVPVAVARERPVSKRTVKSAAVLAGLPMGILLACFVWVVALMIWGENGWGGDWFGWLLLGLLVCGWACWGVVFYRCYSPGDPKAFTARVGRWLLAGSILEMLVAIPSHILARERNDCCAPGITLFGLATGLSVALLAFGPAVFFLLAGRVRAKKGTGG